MFKRAIRSAAKLADAIVCVSDPTARRLHELLDPQCPVYAIPHGIDHDLFRAEGDVDADLATLAAFGIRPPFVAFWGTLEPRKDLATLVAAFDRLAGDLPDLQLAIVGGTGWAHDAFDRALAASPFAERIICTGFVDDPVIPALVRRSAVAVYAAREEGFGLPALEALACGAPVITTRGSVMEEITDGAAWLVDAADAAGLATELADVLSPGSAATRAARRTLGLEVAARYSWDATAAAHEAVYDAVVEGRGGGR